MLQQSGFDVTVFEKAPDVGGVWSRTRRYPGLRTQNNKGLVPDGTFEDIARSTVSLATDGFFERVAEGRIVVHRDRVVQELFAEDGRPHARLSDGTVVPADLIVCGTGFRQRVPFFDDALHARIEHPHGACPPARVHP